jgi:hypothetical protein
VAQLSLHERQKSRREEKAERQEACGYAKKQRDFFVCLLACEQVGGRVFAWLVFLPAAFRYRPIYHVVYQRHDDKTKGGQWHNRLGWLKTRLANSKAEGCLLSYSLQGCLRRSPKDSFLGIFCKWFPIPPSYHGCRVCLTCLYKDYYNGMVINEGLL